MRLNSEAFEKYARTEKAYYRTRNMNRLEDRIQSLEAQNAELQKKLEVATEALQRISEIGYYHDYGDHRAVASKALATIEAQEKV